MPWVSPKDMKSFEIHDSIDHITELAVEKSATTKVPAGTILMVTRSGILRHSFPVAVAKREVTLNQDLKALTPYQGITSAFVAHCLLYLGQRILHECAKDGTTVQSIESLALKSFSIPLAPFPEQLRIVSTLEGLLSDLDAGIDALHQTQAKLERYRAVVLKAAVEGQLTAEWRERNPATEPAPALLQRILTERRQLWEKEQLRKFAEKGKKPPTDWRNRYEEPESPQVDGSPVLPKGWCWATVDQLIVAPIINGVSVQGSDHPPGIPALRLNAMTSRGFDYKAIRYLPLSREAVDDLWIEEGDFFVSRANGSKRLVGRGTIAQPPAHQIIFPDTMMRLRLNQAVHSTRWLTTLWEASVIRVQIEHLAKTTAGIWKISQPNLARIAVPLPPVSEQKAIVEAVEDQLSLIDHLEADIEAKLVAAQSLRQGILHRAFSGQLVPQDPNDESAEKLLTRIAKERKAQEVQRAAARAKRPWKHTKDR